MVEATSGALLDKRGYRLCRQDRVRRVFGIRNSHWVLKFLHRFADTRWAAFGIIPPLSWEGIQCCPLEKAFVRCARNLA